MSEDAISIDIDMTSPVTVRNSRAARSVTLLYCAFLLLTVYGGLIYVMVKVGWPAALIVGGVAVVLSFAVFTTLAAMRRPLLKIGSSGVKSGWSDWIPWTEIAEARVGNSLASKTLMLKYRSSASSRNKPRALFTRLAYGGVNRDFDEFILIGVKYLPFIWPDHTDEEIDLFIAQHLKSKASE